MYMVSYDTSINDVMKLIGRQTQMIKFVTNV
jgi:hypothetical protein